MDIMLERCTIAAEILKQLKNGSLSFDSRGHLRGKPLNRYLDFVFGDALMFHLIETDLVDLVNSIRSGKPLNRFITVATQSSARVCYDCGHEFIVETDGKVARLDTDCPYPNGHPEFSVIAYVPSGKLVFANDMRHLFPEVNDDFDVNQLQGIIQTTESYANAGMFHTFVSNTCPGIYQESPTKINIGNDAWDEDENVIDAVGGKEVGGICTDLWWFSAADYNDVVLRGGLKNVLNNNCTTIVNVKPGTYKMTCRHHLIRDDDYDYTKAQRFATIEKLT